jgi:Meiotically Up-regulated Gene 113 (MUG113) protein
MDEHDRLDGLLQHMLADYSYVVHILKPTGKVYYSVYLAGAILGKPVKIGMAKNPAWRLKGLQSGNAAQLFIHDVFWVEGGEAAAYRVEQMSHRLAGEGSQRLVGEWFLLDRHKAAETVEMACAITGVNFYKRIPHEPGLELPQIHALIPANDN